MTRSIGATTVLATAPAHAPATASLAAPFRLTVKNDDFDGCVVGSTGVAQLFGEGGDAGGGGDADGDAEESMVSFEPIPEMENLR